MGSYVITSDGCSIYYDYDKSQSKPVLVLSNSLGTTLDMWKPQIKALSEHFNLLRYDMRGHGSSDTPPGDYSIDMLGMDLLAVLDQLKLDQVYFCGLSIGGMVGQWLSVNYADRLKGLVLANTSAYAGPPEAWDERIESIRKDGLFSTWPMVRKRWVSNDFAQRNPRVVQELKSIFEQNNQEGYLSTCVAVKKMDLQSVARLNQLPTLIIAGDNDIASPIEKSEYLLNQIPNAQLCILEAGHLSNIEQPNKFSAVLSSFFKAL